MCKAGSLTPWCLSLGHRHCPAGAAQTAAPSTARRACANRCTQNALSAHVLAIAHCATNTDRVRGGVKEPG